MRDFLPIAISVVVVIAVVILLGKKLKFSPRYERKPRILNSWNAQDKGFDPTDEKNL